MEKFTFTHERLNLVISVIEENEVAAWEKARDERYQQLLKQFPDARKEAASMHTLWRNAGLEMMDAVVERVPLTGVSMLQSIRLAGL